MHVKTRQYTSTYPKNIFFLIKKNGGNVWQQKKRQISQYRTIKWNLNLFSTFLTLFLRWTVSYVYVASIDSLQRHTHTQTDDIIILNVFETTIIAAISPHSFPLCTQLHETMYVCSLHVNVLYCIQYITFGWTTFWKLFAHLNNKLDYKSSDWISLSLYIHIASVCTCVFHGKTSRTHRVLT